MKCEDDILIQFDAEIRVNKNGTVDITPKNDCGPVLELCEPPKDSTLLAYSYAPLIEYRCINNTWHQCAYVGGGWNCTPLGFPCNP